MGTYGLLAVVATATLRVRAAEGTERAHMMTDPE